MATVYYHISTIFIICLLAQSALVAARADCGANSPRDQKTYRHLVACRRAPCYNVCAQLQWAASRSAFASRTVAPRRAARPTRGRPHKREADREAISRAEETPLHEAPKAARAIRPPRRPPGRTLLDRSPEYWLLQRVGRR